MYYIEPSAIIGKSFTTIFGSQLVYKCIGYGQPPDAGTLLIVGAHIDTKGETQVKTFPVKEVTFMP
jgi:aspartyl aminopeptidase